MLKISLVALMIAVGGYAGFLYGERVRRRLDFLSQWQTFNRGYGGELLFRRRRVGEWLQTQVFRAEFADFLQNFTSGNLQPSGVLRERENALLLDYFTQIGSSDAEAQGAYLRSVEGEIDELVDSAKKECEVKCRLGTKVGVLIGLTVAILFV